jgi:hypothetical protein
MCFRGTGIGKNQLLRGRVWWRQWGTRRRSLSSPSSSWARTRQSLHTLGGVAGRERGWVRTLGRARPDRRQIHRLTRIANRAKRGGGQGIRLRGMVADVGVAWIGGRNIGHEGGWEGRGRACVAHAVPVRVAACGAKGGLAAAAALAGGQHVRWVGCERDRAGGGVNGGRPVRGAALRGGRAQGARALEGDARGHQRRGKARVRGSGSGRLVVTPAVVAHIAGAVRFGVKGLLGLAVLER